MIKSSFTGKSPAYRRCASSAVGLPAGRYQLMIIMLCMVISHTVYAKDRISAEHINRVDIVKEWKRAALISSGITAKNITVRPSLFYALEYDDNIFASVDNKIDDVISVYSPEISADSILGGHKLLVSMAADLGRYSDASSENYNDWSLVFEDSILMGQNSQFFLGARIAHMHEFRGSANEANGLQPSEFSVNSLYSKFDYSTGRSALALDINVTEKNYDDVLAVSGGAVTLINQDDRDFTDYSLGVQIGRRAFSSSQLFLRVEADERKYKNLQDFTLYDRSSHGYALLLGSEMDVSGRIVGKLFAGYRRQDYRSPLRNVSTPIYGATLDCNITGLTGISLVISRTIKETTNQDFSAYVSTGSAVTLTHELRRTVLLYASIDRADDDYESIGVITQKRDTTVSSAGLLFRINKHLNGSLNYKYIDRNRSTNRVSLDSDKDGDSNRLLLELQAEI